MKIFIVIYYGCEMFPPYRECVINTYRLAASSEQSVLQVAHALFINDGFDTYSRVKVQEK